jgi:hypothetical protein
MRGPARVDIFGLPNLQTHRLRTRAIIASFVCLVILTFLISRARTEPPSLAAPEAATLDPSTSAAAPTR